MKVISISEYKVEKLITAYTKYAHATSIAGYYHYKTDFDNISQEIKAEKKYNKEGL